MENLNVIVICSICGKVAPFTPPDLNNQWGTFHWHQPCPQCGANAWASHDTNRDWKSGRLLDTNLEKI